VRLNGAPVGVEPAGDDAVSVVVPPGRQAVALVREEAGLWPNQKTGEKVGASRTPL
jgi:hypothetical protein